MFVKASITALTLAIAAPAFAGNYTAGEAQLAYSVGVEPGVYTVAELTQIERAQWENDLVLEQNLLNRVTLGGNVSTRNAPSDGAKQLAAIEGVSANQFSVSQIIRLSDADFDNDLILAQEISRENSAIAPVGISAGRAQLAATLGVNAADYTLAELVQLDTVNDPRDNHDD